MTALTIDPGLLERMRRAGQLVAWSPPGYPTPGPDGRASGTARLLEEEARLVVVARKGITTAEATSGPVGALLLLLEADRRGAPAALGGRNAGRDPEFPDGSIVAAWGGDAGPVDSRPTVRDLVELARYALP